MNDTPPERSLSMLLTQGILLLAGVYSSVAVVITLISGTTNPTGFALYVLLLLVMPVISLVAFLKKLPALHRLSMLSLVCLWGWILRALWSWSGSAPVELWEMSALFQAVLLLLTVLSLGIPILVAKLEFERRAAESFAFVTDSHFQSESDPYRLGSSVAFDDRFFDPKSGSTELSKSFDN
ncbi:MAG: hypothetical protein QM785_03320 [Pyrinomonadaceae bacterium]